MIARVTLEMALGREFDYVVPDELVSAVRPGTRVLVPFGPRKLPGVVTELARDSTYPNPRPILKLLGGETVVTPALIRLGRWIARYYCCPLELVMKTLIPDVVRRDRAGWQKRLCVRLVPYTGPFPRLTKRQLQVWHIVEELREVQLQKLLDLAGTTASTVRKLEELGLIEIVPQTILRDPYAREQVLPTTPLSLNEAQAAALKEITNGMDRVWSGGSARSETATGEKDVDMALVPAQPGPGHAQLEAPTVFLLHGVTGSGKTEVYLQAIAHALERGRGAIVLVPEISLTPQTVERFRARFCHGPHHTHVAVLHSHLSAGERHDQWQMIRQGRARIVIGARSAVFAPVRDLGLIIVDEEHEHTYKQEEAPRYNARDVAIVRAQMEGAVVVLGSATPSMESYYNARRGKYRLLTLPQRVDDKKMPQVRIIDMRQAASKHGTAPIISTQLREAILGRLERGEQVILFLNRRGYAAVMECAVCGYVARCPNCSVALTYHRAGDTLLCHICGQAMPAPDKCPEPRCRNPKIKYLGIGTERVEETLRKLFPHATVVRMDSDVMERKEEYRRILGEFRAGKIDILVGTQMIAKGLHFPNVTLVGIVYADLALHQPDFRAAERTFQLITQVAGRAGRGDVEGEVIVQTFTPGHSAIVYARRHDYAGFFERELGFRTELRYPPVTRVALVTLRGRNPDKVQFTANHVRRVLEKVLAGMSVQEAVSATGGVDRTETPVLPPTDTQNVIISGPAPAPILRAHTYYRFQIMLRTRNMTALAQHLTAVQAGFPLPEDVSMSIDVDPLDLM